MGTIKITEQFNAHMDSLKKSVNSLEWEYDPLNEIASQQIAIRDVYKPGFSRLEELLLKYKSFLEQDVERMRGLGQKLVDINNEKMD